MAKPRSFFVWPFKKHEHDFKFRFANKSSESYECSCGENKIINLNMKQPLTAKQFIERYERDYINYGALIEVAFGHGDVMFDEYENLTSEDQRVILEKAKEFAARG